VLFEGTVRENLTLWKGADDERLRRALADAGLDADIAARKPQWIDFDAGPIASGQRSIDALTDDLFDLVLDIASGRVKTKNETHGYREIAIWKDGVTV